MSAKTATGNSRSIKVDYLTRVEGEAAIAVKLKGDQVQDVQLQIFEPPRLFEAFLRGRHYLEVPDIVARICGICPIAYQMSAVHALERILGITVDPAVRLCMSSCCKRRISWASPTPSAWRPTIANWWSWPCA